MDSNLLAVLGWATAVVAIIAGAVTILRSNKLIGEKTVPTEAVRQIHATYENILKGIIAATPSNLDWLDVALARLDAKIDELYDAVYLDDDEVADDPAPEFERAV
jgi:uncharacterized protein involved in response to NO